MASKLFLELISPDRHVLSGEIEMVTLPGSEGDFSVLADHQPLVTSLRPGVVEVNHKADNSTSVYISGGFVQVTNVRCLLLADEAIMSDEFDREALETRIRDIEAGLSEVEADGERQRAETALVALRNLLQTAA